MAFAPTRDPKKAAMREMLASNRLSEKQMRFIEEYLVDMNATRAATAAGYKSSYPNVVGHDLLRHPVVGKRIEEAIKARAYSMGITANRVLEELAKLAFGDIRDIFDEDGKLINPKNLPGKVAARVASIKVNTSTIYDKEGNAVVEYVVELKQHDKLVALDKLARHLGLYRDDEDGKSGKELTIVVRGGLPQKARSRA